ncbi:hypothetical protein SLEP1_g25085 [Rubroshorea leprosula]|uniref:Uncharacterized protein n=1 Tax=Rubroshorea leprosula TaxID=152421 RepID=A0AAV5JS01_9ROSI|nr:hypothetical protein SLEP1_g25085 [Rubroshorea leprosula]
MYVIPRGPSTFPAECRRRQHACLRSFQQSPCWNFNPSPDPVQAIAFHS